MKMRVTRAQAAAQVTIDEAADPTQIGTEDLKGATAIDTLDDSQTQDIDMDCNE